MQLVIAAWLRSWDLFRVRDKIKDQMKKVQFPTEMVIFLHDYD